VTRGKLLVAIWTCVVFGVGVAVGVRVADREPDRVVETPDAPVLLPLEGVNHEVRRLAEPGYTGSWDGSAYDFLFHLDPYLYSWYRRAPTRTFRMAEWVFGVSKETVPDGASEVTSAVVSSQVSLPGSSERRTRYIMWVRRDAATGAAPPSADHE